MVRLAYIGFSVMMAFVPLTFYWAMNKPASRYASTSRYYQTHHPGSTYIFYGGGRGGWLGNTYGSGRGGYVGSSDRLDRIGGASAHRGGGPSAGGK